MARFPLPLFAEIIFVEGGVLPFNQRICAFLSSAKLHVIAERGGGNPKFLASKW